MSVPEEVQAKGREGGPRQPRKPLPDGLGTRDMLLFRCFQRLPPLSPLDSLGEPRGLLSRTGFLPDEHQGKLRLRGGGWRTECVPGSHCL